MVSWGSSNQSTQAKDVTPREYKRLRQPTANYLKNIMQTGGPEYGGPLVAGLTEEEQASIQGVTDYSNRNLTGASRGALEDTIGGRYLTPDSNPFLRDYIAAAQRPIEEAFQDENLARRGVFAAAGHKLNSSSPFAYAQETGKGRYASAIGEVGTKIAGEAYQAERGNQLKAIDQLSSLDQQELARRVEVLKVQALPRLIQQLGYDKGLAEFQRRVAMALQAAGVASSVSVQIASESKGESSNIGILG